MAADTRNETREAISRVAARWAERRENGLSPDVESEFMLWRGADPRHEAAWRAVESSLARVEAVRTWKGAGVVAELAQRAKRRRRRRIGASAVALACAVVLAATTLIDKGVGDDRSRNAVAATVVKPESRRLPDGSLTELSAGAEVQVSYTADVRSVELVRGEAHFEVVPQRDRPFVVSVGGTTVSAVGTAFSVKLEPDGVRVVVTHGKIAVRSPGTDSVAPIYAEVGQRVSVAAGPSPAAPVVETLSPADLSLELAWRTPRVALAGTPLSEAVPIFNRESRTQLGLADARVGALELSGTFPADDAEGFARLLASNYGVRVERTAEGLLLSLPNE